MSHRISNKTDLGMLSSQLIDSTNQGGGPITVLAEAYFDESDSHKSAPVLCLAGYIFQKNDAKTFSRKFSKVLKKHDLPYFHMVDCAHGNAPFDGLTLKQRDKVVRQLIKLVREYSQRGYCIALDKAAYHEELSKSEELQKFFGEEYTFCLHHCLEAVSIWAKQNDHKDGISYIFEAGHESQPEANRVLNDLYNDNKMIGMLRCYSSHTFARKRDYLPLAAADLLAWLSAKDLKRKPDKERRKDLQALLRPEDSRIILSSDSVKERLSYAREMYEKHSLGQYS